MFYRNFSEFGEYCGRLFGRSPMFYHFSWWGVLFAILAIAAVVVAVVFIAKAAGRSRKSDSDEMLDLLKSRYAAGEIDEEEYLRKRKVLKK